MTVRLEHLLASERLWKQPLCFGSVVSMKVVCHLVALRCDYQSVEDWHAPALSFALVLVLQFVPVYCFESYLSTFAVETTNKMFVLAHLR